MKTNQLLVDALPAQEYLRAGAIGIFFRYRPLHFENARADQAGAYTAVARFFSIGEPDTIVADDQL